MIASDKEGEVLAFGTTVPYITTGTTPSKMRDDVNHLVKKLVQNHEEFLATANPQEAPSVTIPVPIQPLPGNTLHDLQMRCVAAVTVVGQCLQSAGYSLTSVTPIAMSESGDGSDVRAGYLLAACKKDNEQYVMKTGSAEDIARAWTERAHHYYGQAAIAQFQHEMAERMEGVLGAMMTKPTSDDKSDEKAPYYGPDDTVH